MEYEGYIINESSIYEFVTDKKPLGYHVYNMKRNKHYQNTLPFFYKIYNVSAMKMHQLAQHVGGCVRAIFTDTIIVENPERKPILSTDIGGVRISKIPESNFSLLRVSHDHLPCGAVVMQSVASTAPYLLPAGQLRLIPIYYAP